MKSDKYTAVMEAAENRRQSLKDTCEQIWATHTPRVLEIGCGHGHYLNAYADTNNDSVCIGIDLISQRISKSCRKRDLAGNANRLHFLKAEVGEFLDALPEGRHFETVFMLFPDPWPKKRHHRRRMVQNELLTRLAKTCLPQAKFCFRTDFKAYFEWTIEHLNKHNNWEIDSDMPWPFESESYFQNLLPEYQSVIAINQVHGA